MHNKLVRNEVIFFIVVLYVISAKDGLVNALFAIWAGTWAMSKLFKFLFGPHQGFENLTVDKFILTEYVSLIISAIGLMLENRKLAFFVLLWWSSGILAAFVTYKLLNALLVSS